MNIKVKDIVVNVLSADRVGQYVEKYDVRILPEMISDKKYAEVMYIDDDGAIITKEFGPYAYPADALRLATEEEKKEYEVEKYTLVMKYKGNDFTLPLTISKTMVNAGITIGKDNVDASDSIIRYVKDSWSVLLRGQEEVKCVLLQECYDVIKRRISAGRGYCPSFEPLITLIFESKNNDMKAEFAECFFANPVQDKDLYRCLEHKGMEVPEVHAKKVKEVSGYLCACMIKGMDLYDFLRENRRYDSYFPHYNQLTVTNKGLDLLISLDWGRSETKRILEKLNMDMEKIKYLLLNPKRSFAIEMGTWFKNLEWSEISENIDMFRNCLEDVYDLKRRLSNGKYISPEYVGVLFLHSGCSHDLMLNGETKNKSELKLKEMVSFLGSLSDDITLSDLESQSVNADGSIRENDEAIVESGDIGFSNLAVSFDSSFF